MPPRRSSALVFLGVLVLLVAIAGFAGWSWFQKMNDLADAYHAETIAYIDRVEARFEDVPLLTSRERALLRRSRNARHVEVAQQFGIEPPAKRTGVDTTVLSPLMHTDEYLVDDMTYSIPYLVPSGVAALDSIGARFSNRLAEAGLPAYRFFLTSGLRTKADQAALRRVNSNAAAGVSSHSYGTTFDVSYSRFRYGGPPPDAPPEPPEELPDWWVEDIVDEFETRAANRFSAMAEEYESRLVALLARAHIELEDEGVLITVMERRQPVFHSTAARDVPRQSDAAALAEADADATPAR
jgi:hypothetical protein